MLASVPALFACYAYLPYSFDTSCILPRILPLLQTTYPQQISVRPALESTVFPSVLPLDYSGAVVALPTSVPAGLPIVRFSFPM